MRERTSPDRPGGSASDMENPYRPYVAYAPAMQDTRRHGAMLFHDGNAGHFWRGELAAQVGDIFFIVGLLLWITILTYSPVAIALIVGMNALPWVLAGPLAAPLQSSADPGRLLRRVGSVRVACALGLVALQLLHYRGITFGFEYPVVYALVFVAALAGRLRAQLRVAAAQVCLAPGELELVANDLQIGSAVVAVVAPLLAALLFVLPGDRILLVAIGATIAYFISMSAEGLLDALPVGRRAVSRARLETEIEDERQRAELREAAEPDEKKGVAFAEEQSDDEARRVANRALPEWLQPGPTSVSAAFTDLRAGLGLSGLANSSRMSLYLLGALALIGGGLGVLEVFYVAYVLNMPIFYLGPLLACEAGGLVLGGFVAGGMLERDGWRAAIALGLAAMGIALVLLGLFPALLLALLAALLLGAGNALVVTGARRGLRAGYDGPERRALTAAESFVSGLCGAAGTAIFLGFYLYLSPTYFSLQRFVAFGPLQRFNLNPSYSPWGLNDLFLVTGLLLLVLCVGVGVVLAAAGVGPRPQKVGSPGAVRGPGLAGGLASDGLLAQDDDGDAWADGESMAYDSYDSRYAPSSQRAAPYGRASAYRAPYGSGAIDDAGYGDYRDHGNYGRNRGRGGYGGQGRAQRGPYGYDQADEDGYGGDDGW